MDPAVGAQVVKLVAAEGVVVFEGLVRRDVPGEAVHIRVEVGQEKVSWPERLFVSCVCVHPRYQQWAKVCVRVLCVCPLEVKAVGQQMRACV